MQDIIVAVLGFAGTLLGSLFGILTAQKLTQYRLVKAEEDIKQQRSDHSTLKERTTRLEGRMNEAEHDILDLKKYHKPN